MGSAGLALLLALSVGLNVILLLMDGRRSELSLAGTYCTADTASPAAAEGLYLALERTGTYCLYRQGEKLSEGKYEDTSPRGSYALYSRGDEISQLIWTDEVVYLLDSEGITLFSKFSDIPTYINIS